MLSHSSVLMAWSITDYMRSNLSWGLLPMGTKQ